MFLRRTDGRRLRWDVIHRVFLESSCRPELLYDLISFTWRETQLHWAAAFKPDRSAAGDQSLWRSESTRRSSLTFLFHTLHVNVDFILLPAFLFVLCGFSLKTVCFSMRFCRWKWTKHQNYVSGFMIFFLSLLHFSFLQKNPTN